MASYCCAPCKALCACCGKSGCHPGDCCCPSGNKPNCFFFGFTSLFAIAPMIACLTVAITSFSGSGCFTHNQTNLGIFLMIDALLFFLFILFAWRVQRMLAKPYEKSSKQPGCCGPEVWSRVWQFMWKDITFLIFLIVAGCAIAWNVIGLFWANIVDEANKYRSRTICYVGMVKMARWAAGIMFCFLALLPFAFLIAVLIETASSRRKRAARADVEAGGAPAAAAAGPSSGTTQPQVAPSAGMHQAAAAMSEAAAKADAKVHTPTKPAAPAPAASEPAMGYPVAPNTPGLYPPIPTGAAAPASRDVSAPSVAPSAAPAAATATAPSKESAAKDAAKAAGHAVADAGKSLAQGISSLLHKKDKPAADAAAAPQQ